MNTTFEISVSDTMDTAETQTRADLAACHRLVAHFGMSDLIFTHISARVPGGEGSFLITPYGLLFEEVTASSLVLVDSAGTSAADADRLNPAGIAIHAAILGARDDVGCVIHTHSLAGIVVSCSQKPLQMLCQHAAKFAGSVGIHDYEGIVHKGRAQDRLVDDLADNMAVILKNHGLLAVGRTVSEAFHTIYHLEVACRVQVATAAFAEPPIVLSPEIAERTAEQFRNFPQPLGRREWPALLRLAARLDPGFRI